MPVLILGRPSLLLLIISGRLTKIGFGFIPLDPNWLANCSLESEEHNLIFDLSNIMTQPYQQLSQGSSEKSPSSHSKQVLHHVLKNVLNMSKDERVSFSKWMEYMDYDNVND